MILLNIGNVYIIPHRIITMAKIGNVLKTDKPHDGFSEDSRNVLPRKNFQLILNENWDTEKNTQKLARQIDKDFFPDKTNYFELQNRRYIGNKHKLIEWIFSILDEECEGKSFTDIFAGTGIVAATACRHFDKVILNDFLYSNQVIYKAFFGNGKWNRNKIDNIIRDYNRLNAEKLDENYFSINFAGKYFSENSAKIIGFIREDIEVNKKNFTEREYNILISSLLYSVDRIANTVGHYDAYIKQKFLRDRFFMRSIKPIETKSVRIFREDANLLAKRIKTDIVYIDPPYNSRQYSRFYHVIETLTKWDKPKLYGVALKPAPENMSDYCRVCAKDKFAELVNDIDAQYLVVSYNNTYASKSHSSKNKITLAEIENILSKRGKTKIYQKNYRHFNSGNTDFNDHKEYLFVTTTNRSKKIRRSPLFYVGDKYRLMKQLSNFFPQKVNNFYEPFVGGGTVFLNIAAEKYFLNDIDKHLVNIHKFFISKANKPEQFFRDVEKIVNQYKLSYSYKKDIVPAYLKKEFVKTYYARFNKEGYQKLRYQSNKEKNNNPLILYILLIYGFNRMLRFNRDKEFNLPVGNVDFNKNVADALNNYFGFVSDKRIKFTTKDFRKFFERNNYEKDDFVYLDPPYLITACEYNKLWDIESEIDLLNLIDELDRKNVKFALSNVTHYNNYENELLIEWMKKYRVCDIESNYISYHNNTGKKNKEVLITNY